MDFNAQQLLQSELEPGERLLWAAKPNPQRAFVRQTPMILFGGCFTGFALFWMMGAAAATWAGRGMGAPFPFMFFPFFGVPFVLVGIFIIAQPFMARSKAQNGACGITDRRAILIEGASGGPAGRFAIGARSVKSYGKRDLHSIERRDLNDGTSDVVFARERVNNRNGSSWSEIGFWGVPNGREAERLLRNLLNPPSNSSHDSFQNSGAVDWAP